MDHLQVWKQIYYFNCELFLKDDKIHFSSSRKETKACPRDQEPWTDILPPKQTDQSHLGLSTSALAPRGRGPSLGAASHHSSQEWMAQYTG